MADLKLPKLKKVNSIERRDKKKILLLSDDLRMHSGVGVMSREIVMGTIDKFDWATELKGTHEEIERVEGLIHKIDRSKEIKNIEAL